MTSAKRQAALKARREGQGLRLVSVWVPHEFVEEIRALAKFRMGGWWKLTEHGKWERRGNDNADKR